MDYRTCLQSDVRTVETKAEPETRKGKLSYRSVSSCSGKDLRQHRIKAETLLMEATKVNVR